MTCPVLNCRLENVVKSPLTPTSLQSKWPCMLVAHSYRIRAVQAGRDLLHTAWPQAFHQDANAITWRCGFVYSLQFNHAYLLSTPSGFLAAFDCECDFRSPSHSEYLGTSVTPVHTVN